MAGTRPGLTFSNRSKVFWPEEGFSKGDLLDYYASISKVMLPFLRERPVVLVRHPDGIHGKSFFQWNVPRGTPEWIRTLALRDPDEPDHDKKTVFLIDDLDTLLYIINLGCIPVHVLASRAGQPDHADFITFDLDLNEQPFSRAIEIALSLREILSDAGLTGFPKTSGQGGLHVLVPLGPSVPFVAAKLLVELLGRLVTARHAAVATMERRVDKRGGRLYVDTGQTGTSRTIVAPYSVRAWPGATVSTPLFWDELSGALDPGRFTLMTVPARVAELGDPFAELLEARPDIGAALNTIERWLK
jgi:bifunctional non-homologous end joining protein LigD